MIKLRIWIFMTNIINMEEIETNLLQTKYIDDYKELTMKEMFRTNLKYFTIKLNQTFFWVNKIKKKKKLTLILRWKCKLQIAKLRMKKLKRNSQWKYHMIQELHLENLYCLEGCKNLIHLKVCRSKISLI